MLRWRLSNPNAKISIKNLPVLMRDSEIVLDSKVIKQVSFGMKPPYLIGFTFGEREGGESSNIAFQYKI
jgi:hypothetical protein